MVLGGGKRATTTGAEPCPGEPVPVVSRPARPKLADLDRRAVLRGGAALAAGAALYGSQEVAVRIAGNVTKRNVCHPSAPRSIDASTRDVGVRRRRATTLL